MSSLLRKLFSSPMALKVLFVLAFTLLLTLVLSSSIVALAGPDAIGP